jgi:hypothetical protein
MVVPFPYVNVAEAVSVLVDTPPGMFAWRRMLGEDLLSFPDLGGGDLDAEQRQEGLERFVELHRPQTALALFWSVVALEDLFRDMGVRLNALPELRNYFKDIAAIAPQPKSNAKPGGRLDKEPEYTQFKLLNKLYQNVFCIDAVDPDPTNIDHLDDLVLIRHTVAHHGAIVRAIDLSRFRYYQMQVGRTINPPVSFVRDIENFVYKVGSVYLHNLQQRIFDVIIAAEGKPDPAKPPDWIKDLVRTFHYFGQLVVFEPQPLLTTLEEMQQRHEAAAKAAETELLQRCLAKLPATN